MDPVLEEAHSREYLQSSFRAQYTLLPVAIFGHLVQCASIIAAWYSDFGSYSVVNNKIVSAAANLLFDAVQLNVLAGTSKFV